MPETYLIVLEVTLRVYLYLRVSAMYRCWPFHKTVTFRVIPVLNLNFRLLCEVLNTKKVVVEVIMALNLFRQTNLRTCHHGKTLSIAITATTSWYYHLSCEVVIMRRKYFYQPRALSFRPSRLTVLTDGLNPQQTCLWNSV
jgi:hypothetical protein